MLLQYKLQYMRQCTLQYMLCVVYVIREGQAGAAAVHDAVHHHMLFVVVGRGQAEDDAKQAAVHVAVHDAVHAMCGCRERPRG